MSKVYDFSTYQAAATLTDFPLKVSKEQTILIPPPDVDAVLELDEALTPRRQLELLCGSEWPAVHALFAHCQPGVLNAFLVDLKAHFGMEAPAG
jgi:hypothetical protein